MKSIIIFSEFRSNLIRVIRIHMNTIHIFYSYRLAVTQLRLSESACLPVRVPLVPTERTVAHIQILRYSRRWPIVSSMPLHDSTCGLDFRFSSGPRVLRVRCSSPCPVPWMLAKLQVDVLSMQFLCIFDVNATQWCLSCVLGLIN